MDLSIAYMCHFPPVVDTYPPIYNPPCQLWFSPIGSPQLAALLTYKVPAAGGEQVSCVGVPPQPLRRTDLPQSAVYALLQTIR